MGDDSLKACGKNIRIEGKLIRIARLDADTYHFVDDPDPVLKDLRSAGKRVDLFTFMQRLPETTPKFNFAMEWDNLAALPISTFDEWWTKQIGFKARNKAKQAEKRGVVLREVPFDDALVQGITAIYNECPVRQGKPFRHYGKGAEAIRREQATYLETSFFIGAFLGETLIGFTKVVTDETGTQAGLMNIVSMIQHRDKAPTNALVAHAVRACAARGIRYLVYSRFGYGNKQTDSLSDFKERNGFQRIDLPRYYIPLTRTGALALRLGLHRKFVDFVPEPVLANVREWRNAWYNRKLQSVTEAS